MAQFIALNFIIFITLAKAINPIILDFETVSLSIPAFIPLQGLYPPAQ